MQTKQKLEGAAIDCLAFCPCPVALDQLEVWQQKWSSAGACNGFGAGLFHHKMLLAERVSVFIPCI